MRGKFTKLLEKTLKKRQIKEYRENSKPFKDNQELKAKVVGDKVVGPDSSLNIKDAPMFHKQDYNKIKQYLTDLLSEFSASDFGENGPKPGSVTYDTIIILADDLLDPSEEPASEIEQILWSSLPENMIYPRGEYDELEVDWRHEFKVLGKVNGGWLVYIDWGDFDVIN